MRLRVFAPLVALACPLLAATAAFAQSSPGWSYGYVPSAAEWNAAFAAKQDTLGYIPCNVAGCTMTGPIMSAPSTSFSTGFNIAPGVTPGTPNNGDLWIDPYGLWVRIAGNSLLLLGPLGGPTTPPFNLPQNATGTFTSGGVAFFTGSVMASSGMLAASQLVLGGGTGAAPTSFAGTPGGVPYFTTGGAIGSSAALALNQLVAGGGVGNAPATFTVGGDVTFAWPNFTVLKTNGVAFGPLATQSTVSNTVMANMPALTIKSNATAAVGAPADNSLSALLDATFGSAQGTSVLYRGAANWTALPPGTAGQVLTSGGTGANPAWGSSTGATSTSTPPNPAGVSTVTAKMAGLGGSITPQRSGNVLFIINGSGSSNAAGGKCSVQVAYGTGAAPINGAPPPATPPGYTVGAANVFQPEISGSIFICAFSVAGSVSGLTLQTPYWIDLQQAAPGGGTCTLTTITVTAVEL